MTTFKSQGAETDGTARAATTDTAPASNEDDRKLTLAEILELLAGGRLPLRFTAYDGSSAGPEDAPFGLELTSPRGTTYLATARGDLGLARAYIAGDIEVHGVHPGDPYELLKALADELVFRMPPPRAWVWLPRPWSSARPCATSGPARAVPLPPARSPSARPAVWPRPR